MATSTIAAPTPTPAPYSAGTMTTRNPDGTVTVTAGTPTSGGTLSNPLSQVSGQADGTYGVNTNDPNGAYIQSKAILPALSTPASDSIWGIDPSKISSSDLASAQKYLSSTGAPAPAPAPSPGIVAGAVGAAPAPGMQYTPWNVTPNQTVEGRIQSIVNGAIGQQATTNATEQATARGLQNSDLAISAGEQAAYAAAQPIAAADAATQAKAAGYNADIQNQIGMQGQQLASQKSIAQLNADTQLATTGMNNKTQLATTGMNNQTALAQTSLSTEAQKAIATMDNATQTQINTDLNANRVLLQNSQAATNLANQYALNVGNIMADTSMDEPAKEKAIQSQRDIFNQSIAGLSKASPGIPDVSSTLVFNNDAQSTSGFGSGDGSGNTATQTQ